LSNVWLVRTNLPVQYIKARLAPHLTSNDKLYICDVGTEAIGVNLDCDLTPGPEVAANAEQSTFFMASVLRSILRRRSKLLTAATIVSPITAATAESSRSA
jgi:hypothetical protein